MIMMNGNIHKNDMKRPFKTSFYYWQAWMVSLSYLSKIKKIDPLFKTLIRSGI